MGGKGAQVAGARRRASLLALTVLGLPLVLGGCSSHKKADPAPPVKDLVATTAFEKAAVTDGAAALWSLRDASGLAPSHEVADLTSGKSSATVVGGTIAETVGPDGEPATQFGRSGRLITPINSGMSSADSFSLELNLRQDLCVTAWGRVAGTTILLPSGREGFEFIHFPRLFKLNPCNFGVEFWHLGKHLGGCHPARKLLVDGVWTHWSVVYAGGVVTCYENGKQIERTKLTGAGTFSQAGPFGIGGSGSGFQGPLDGASISEVALYKRALTAPEVAAHAALVAARPTPSPSATP